MAQVVLGMATSHGPMLSTPPPDWVQRVPADKANKAHSFRGNTYTFEELYALRKHEQIAQQITPAIWHAKHARCQHALKQLADTWEDARPDVAVIFGNDQMELFGEENIPSFAAYIGDTICNSEYDADQMARLPVGIPISVPGHIPPGGAEYPGCADLATHIVESLSKNAIDVSVLRRFPQHHTTIPHAFGFVYRQVMRDRVVPSVPLFINTFYPPNQPTASRCRHFGHAVLQAVQSWSADLRVALIASGGLSHFVIDEKLDREVLSSLQNKRAEIFESIDESFYQSGSSEIKNWIPLASAMAELDWPARIVDYVPCYRTEAGTGNAMAFVSWRPDS